LFFFRLYRIGGKSKKGGRAHQQNGHKKHRKTVTRVKMSEFHAQKQLLIKKIKQVNSLFIKLLKRSPFRSFLEILDPK
jgi:hypothetical protein